MFFLAIATILWKIVFHKALISRINMNMSIRGRENISEKDLDVVLHH